MTTEPRAEWLRPSMLPKLALCGSYRPESDAGEAAARGTKLDIVFRALIAGENVKAGDLLEDEREAVRWAVTTAKLLADGLRLDSSEETLRVEALGLQGTADLLCEEGAWSADLKSGQKRNYREQQAAYALGFMNQTFHEEWKVYLLFCDLQEVETLRYTRAEAESIVRSVIAKATDAGQVPEPNDYCGWCAKRWTCDARREAIGIIPFDGADSAIIESISSPALRDFVLRAKVVEEFADKAREILQTRAIDGEKTPGVALTSKRGARKVLWKWVEAHWKEIGTMEIGKLVGAVSESKLLPIVERLMPGTKIADDCIEETPGSTFIRVGRPK